MIMRQARNADEQTKHLIARIYRSYRKNKKQAISHKMASKIQLQENSDPKLRRRPGLKMDLWEEGTIMMAGARLDTGSELLEALKFVSARAYGTNLKLKQRAV